MRLTFRAGARVGLFSAAAVSLAYGSTFVHGTGLAGAAPTAAGLICPSALSPERDLPVADSKACQAASRPGDARDLASLNSQLVARSAAPFNRTAPGAFRNAVAARAAMGVSAAPGAGFGWIPAGPSPLCDGHTNESSLCPLANNTSVQLSNGDYTISALGHKTLSGRITSFAGDPGNPNRVFAAPTMGGVYETTDAGMTWHSIGDKLPTQTMGAVAYDAKLHRIFAGTGDNAFGGDSVSGMGTFYSDNDGATWLQSAGIPDLSLSFRIVPSPADASGMTVYQATSRGLYRSDDGGVSFHNLNLPSAPAGYTVPDPTQGGKQVSCAGNTTAPLCFFANIVTDVVVKKDASAKGNAPAGAVMAVLGWRAGAKKDTNPDGTVNNSCQLNGTATPCLQAPQNGLYESDSGAANSFTYQAHTGSPPGLDFPDSSIVGRTTLGIADGAGQNNDAVFALVQDAQKFQHCVDALDTSVPAKACNGDAQGIGLATVLNGAYASYDFGKSWTKVMDYSQLRTGGNTALIGVPGYGPGVQSWYNNWIKPDPTVMDANGNPTRVILGLEEIWENNMNIPTVLTEPYYVPSNQGAGAASPWIVIGRYWNDCGGLNATGGITCNPTANDPSSSTPSTTHPDQHAYLFIPDGNGGVTLFAGNDGGAFKQHVASGTDFSNANWGDGINNGLYTLQPYDAAIAKDGTIVSGLQDNGEMKIAPNGQEAHTIFGGDGFMNTIDPNNSQNIIEEYTYGASNVSLDGGKNWYPITPGPCNSSEAQFSTVLEQDPTIPGHVIEGCTQIQEMGGPSNTTAYANPCAAPPNADPFTCQVVSPNWVTVFDLGTAATPGSRGTECQALACDPFNIPSAVGVRGESIYVGYCGWCDVVTGGLPFNSGIATNVGGDKPPKFGASDGWHFASAKCVGCGTANGLLPKRYITSTQIDPVDNQTVYVTLGGYGRRWIPPGALGDDVSNVGNGHVFVSHDAGEHFTDISGNLPDIPANWTVVHNGQLLVATDAGVFIAPTKAGVAWGQLGTGLPNVPVFTMRLQPGNNDRMVIATYGRGDWLYCFAGPCATGANVTRSTTTGSNGSNGGSSGNGGTTALIGTPNTSAVPAPLWPALGAATLLVAIPVQRRRKRRSS
jgi:photosystem II stability/assembly factor-like uncharacterized protein